MTNDLDFRQGMRRLVAGVCLVTTLDQNERHGMIATAVSSVTTDPPSLLACINRNSSIHAPLQRSMVFCINVLSVDDLQISSCFSSSSLRHKRFVAGEWTTLATGSPVLADASVSFDCRVTELVETATHSIVLGVVEAINLGGPKSPLAYLDGKYGTFQSEITY